MNVEVIWPSQKPTYLKILGSDSPVKCGGQATCSEFVVCGQLMLVVNPDPVINLETQVFRENQALLYMFVYDKATGLSGGLKKILVHITLRRDEGERFYCYGYSKVKKIPCYIAL